MKFREFIRRLFASPLKVVLKILLYVIKIYAFALFQIGFGIVAGIIGNPFLSDLILILSAYGFFFVWTYMQRSLNSDAETDYTEKLGKRGFSLSDEIKMILNEFNWNLVLETAVFYIVLTAFMPMILAMSQFESTIAVASAAAYVLQPILNVLIWAAVRKHWHKKYRRWARHKKKQEFVDNSYDDVEERT